MAAPESDRFELLSGTARQVWELLASPRGVADIATALSKVYGVEPRNLLPDIQTLLEQLTERDLVEEVDERDG